MIRLIVSASALAALVSIAEAAPRCAPGKIYRVTQKVCVDKSAATRAGVYTSRQARAKASTDRRVARLERARAKREAQIALSRAAREERRRAKREDTRVVARDELRIGAPAADKPSGRAAREDSPRAIILSPVKTVIGSATSPFGPLLDPWRSDRVNAHQETLFSLRLSVED